MHIPMKTAVTNLQSQAYIPGPEAAVVMHASCYTRAILAKQDHSLPTPDG